jgi:MFS family permease
MGMGAAGPVLAEYALIVVSLRIVFVRLPDQLGAVPLSAFALIGSAIGMAILGVVHDPLGVYLGTAVFASGIAFLFPALLALAVSRVDEMERGSVVGTTTAFVDLSFGVGPAVLGFLAGSIGYDGAFVVSAVIAAVGAVVLALRRHTLVAQPGPA